MAHIERCEVYRIGEDKVYEFRHFNKTEEVLDSEKLLDRERAVVGNHQIIGHH